MSISSRWLLIPAAILLATSVSGCFSFFGFGATRNDRECLMRAMYFESQRSSDEGMLAVGTVVMNRLADRAYPKTICGVVGQPNQFAPGVLTRSMTEPRSVERAARVAERILRGERHRGVRQAKHFHTAGLRFPYRNMHYVLEAGGNEFYERH